MCPSRDAQSGIDFCLPGAGIASTSSIAQLPRLTRGVSDCVSGDERAMRVNRPGLRDQARMFTARAITSPTVTNDSSACASMASLARPDRGIVSVGLNAVELVKLT